MSNWLQDITDEGIDHFEFAFEQARRSRTGVAPSMGPALPLAIDALPLPFGAQVKSTHSLSLTRTQKSIPKPVVYARPLVVTQNFEATAETTALQNAERPIGVDVLRRALPLRFARIDARTAQTYASPAVTVATHGSSTADFAYGRTE